MASMSAVDRWRHSQRNCARPSIAQLEELRWHEPCCCSSRARSPCPGTQSSSARSPHPVAGTRKCISEKAGDLTGHSGRV